LRNQQATAQAVYQSLVAGGYQSDVANGIAQAAFSDPRIGAQILPQALGARRPRADNPPASSAAPPGKRYVYSPNGGMQQR